MTVREYIRNSWEKSLRKKGHRADGIPLPYPYNSPCAEGIFDEFYYWDTCFINKGLIADEKIEDALHNALDMAFLIQKYGYMPNAAVTGMLNRTQPPVFGIKKKKKKLIPTRRYAIWQTEKDTLSPHYIVPTF